MHMLIQIQQLIQRTIQQDFLYMGLYSNFLYVKYLTQCFRVVQISLLEKRAGNLSVKDFHVFTTFFYAERRRKI